MGAEGSFQHRNRNRQEYCNVVNGNGNIYGCHHGYIHIKTLPIKTTTVDEQNLIILGVRNMQYILKQGLKIFGKNAEEDIKKELTQLHDMTTFILMDPVSLTK